MIVKTTLEEYKDNKEKLKILEKQLEVLENNIEDITGISLDEKTGETYKISNVIESNYIKKELKIEKVKCRIRYIRGAIDLAEFFINIIEGEEEKRILRQKYKEGISYSELGKKLNLSESGVRMKANRAVNKIENIVSIEWVI